jgi:hypothetical protein
MKEKYDIRGKKNKEYDNKNTQCNSSDTIDNSKELG